MSGTVIAPFFIGGKDQGRIADACKNARPGGAESAKQIIPVMKLGIGSDYQIATGFRPGSRLDAGR